MVIFLWVEKNPRHSQYYGGVHMGILCAVVFFFFFFFPPFLTCFGVRVSTTTQMGEKEDMFCPRQLDFSIGTYIILIRRAKDPKENLCKKHDLEPCKKK
jgi:hypothetical protein